MKALVKILVFTSFLFTILAVGGAMQGVGEPVAAQQLQEDGLLAQLDSDPLGRYFPQPVPYNALDAGAGARFGSPVAIDGDTALSMSHSATVDGKEGQGAAYIFTRGEDGIWTQEQKLKANDGAANDYFGVGGALDGDTAMVGAVGADDSQGAVYVFTRGAGGWTQTQKLVNSDGVAGDGLGISIVIDDDTALIGAGQRNTGPGAVYVFVRDGGVWSEQQELTASDKMDNDFFGRSVDLDGDTALIGAYNVDVDGKSDQGAAYVFTRTATTWTEQKKLIASDGLAGDRMGWVVSVQGDTAFAGAPAVGSGNDGAGTVYTFSRSGTVWTENMTLSNPYGISDDRYGGVTALDGDWAIIGAQGENNDTGAAYVYLRDETGFWSVYQRVVAPGGMPGDSFGMAADLENGRAIIGAFNVDIDGKEDAGKFYISESWEVTNRVDLPLIMAK